MSAQIDRRYEEKISREEFDRYLVYAKALAGIRNPEAVKEVVESARRAHRILEATPPLSRTIGMDLSKDDLGDSLAKLDGEEADG